LFADLEIDQATFGWDSGIRKLERRWKTGGDMESNSDLRDRAGLENTEATSRERMERDIDSNEVRSRLTGDARERAREEEMDEVPANRREE
jgi:hypothetical protein